MGALACRLRGSRRDRVPDRRSLSARTSPAGRRCHPAAVPRGRTGSTSRCGRRAAVSRGRASCAPARAATGSSRAQAVSASARPRGRSVRPPPRHSALGSLGHRRRTGHAPALAARRARAGAAGVPAGRGRVGVCWAVLVMTLCMGVPVGSARDVPGSNFWLGILYGAPGRGGKDVAARVGGAGTFAYPGDSRASEPITAGMPRVNSGREVDGSEGVGGDSIGDTRTYPEGPPGGAAPSAERSSPRHSDYESGQPCASTSP